MSNKSKDLRLVILVLSVVMILGVGVGFGLNFFFNAPGTEPSSAVATPAPAPAVEAGSELPQIQLEAPTSPTAPPVQSSFSPSPVMYSGTPQKFMAVETGSTGQKYFASELYPNGAIKIVKDEFHNFNLLDREDNVGSGLDSLEVVMKRMMNEYQVPGRNVLYFGSSGFAQSEFAASFKDMARKRGYLMWIINEHQEGLWGFKKSVPNGYRDNSVFIDLGGGNSKISAIADGKIRSGSTLGTKSYDKCNNCYQQLQKEISNIFQDNPSFGYKSNIFLTGGTPYILSGLKSPGSPEEYIPLFYNDINYLEGQIRNNWESYVNNSAYSAYTNIYNQQRLLAGITVLKSLYEKIGNNKPCFFVRNSNWAVQAAADVITSRK